MAHKRDDFSEATKLLLARRAGFRCSNPKCRKHTSGSNADPNRATNIGVAAHICAAAIGGPRYNPKMTMEERKSPHNGIWLCQSCSKLIDADPLCYSKEKLEKWKNAAEETSRQELECLCEGNLNVNGKLQCVDESTPNVWFSQNEKNSACRFGYKSVDGFCQLVEGSVVLISGYTGVGIDTFIQNVVRHNIKTGSNVVYFNLKEARNTIVNSLIAAESLVRIDDIRNAHLTEEAWERISCAINLLNLDRLIFEPYDSNISAMADRVLSAIRDSNADLVVLDDLDGLAMENPAVLKAFLYQLRNTANQSGTMVFILLDLDEIPRRIDKRPVLSDSKVRSIVKFCDIVQFLYYDNANDFHSSNSEPRVLELIVAKNHLAANNGLYYLTHIPAYSLVIERETTDELQSGVLDKYPGILAGVKTLVELLEKQ